MSIFSRRKANTVVAVVADTHPNSTVGLCPPEVTLDDGGMYQASKAQRWLWQNWLDFWGRVRSLKNEHRARVYAVFNGDGSDDNRHSQHQLVTVNKSVIVDIGEAVIKPAREIADRIFCIRGTEAHVGGSGELEELIAHRVGAVQDDETGHYSWWHLPLVAAGVEFDICHHPRTAAYRPWTRGAAADRQAAIIISECAEQCIIAPDVAIRSHVHYFADSGVDRRPRTFYTPPWQLTTSFFQRLGAGASVEPVGGLIFVCRDGRYTVEPVRYEAERREPWTE